MSPCPCLLIPVAVPVCLFSDFRHVGMIYTHTIWRNFRFFVLVLVFSDNEYLAREEIFFIHCTISYPKDK